MGEDDFAAFMRGQDTAPARSLSRGDKLRCRVIHVGGESVFVDLGTRAEGRIPRVQLQHADGSASVKVGDTVEATVMDPEADGGPLLSVVLTGDQRIDLSALQLALEAGTPVEGRVSQAVKGGLEIDLAGVRAFCPASQAGDSYVADLTTLVGEPVRVQVIEIRDAGRSVVVSRRKVLAAERAQAAQRTVEALQVGAVVEGTVSSLQKYGAFVDIGGVEGLVHISELSPRHVAEAGEVVSVGERVKVKVLSVEQQDKGPRVRLSMKALQQTGEPGEGAAEGEVLQAEVVRMLPHGVVVNTPRGEGMIPVRELGLAHGSDHRRAVSIGQKLEVTWLGAPSSRPRFSVIRVEAVRAKQDYDAYRASHGGEQQAGMGNLGALLGHMDRAKLPKGPKPAPIPAARPVPAPVPAPVAAAATATATEPGAPAGAQRGAATSPTPPAPTTATGANTWTAPDTEAPTDGEPDAPKPRRRRIVSKR